MPPPPLFSFELDCTLPDFLEFFRRSDETVRRPLARITAKVGNTVTTVAVSLNQRRIAFGSMDCFARVYDVYTGECVVARKFAKQVTAIALSSRGGELGIGCFGGALEWWRLVDTAPDATPKFAWAHTGDINGIAVSAFDTMPVLWAGAQVLVLSVV